MKQLSRSRGQFGNTFMRQDAYHVRIISTSSGAWIVTPPAFPFDVRCCYPLGISILVIFKVPQSNLWKMKPLHYPPILIILLSSHHQYSQYISVCDPRAFCRSKYRINHSVILSSFATSSSSPRSLQNALQKGIGRSLRVTQQTP